MITYKNQWNQPFQGKNLRMIWPSYPQGKQIHYDRMEIYNSFSP